MYNKFTTTLLAPKSTVYIVISLVTLLILGGAGVVYANYEERIRELNQENQQTRQQQSELEEEASSIEDVLQNLSQRISSVESQIANNRNKQAEVEREIAQAQEDIEKARETLGSNIKEMYFADKMSTVEMLATSNNISEYIDKQAYRSAVSSKIQDTLEEIENLKKELDEQKTALNNLIQDQEVMQVQLSEDRNENNRLLALNEEQQEEYEEEIDANNERIAELRAQQARENTRNIVGPTSTGFVGTGSYPWANVPFPNRIVDPWGMFKRQCVSYTAWKVASTGRHMPFWGGRGNANRWPANARAAGIPVDTTPKVGSVAVSMAGFYGHTMYVEEVHGDNTITVSDYNLRWDGRYSRYQRTTSGLQFIHF